MTVDTNTLIHIVNNVCNIQKQAARNGFDVKFSLVLDKCLFVFTVCKTYLWGFIHCYKKRFEGEIDKNYESFDEVCGQVMEYILN